MLDYIWLIPVLPALGAMINGIFGKRFPKSVINVIACGTVALSFMIAVLCVNELREMEPRVFEKNFYTWIPGGSSTITMGNEAGRRAEVSVPMGFLLDPLSSIMILVVTGVGFLIHVYSTGYMAHEDGYYRFFTYLNLFMFAMLILV